MDVRPSAWRLLSGIIPLSLEAREGTLAKKRTEYAEMLPVYYDRREKSGNEGDMAMHHQISIDVPRTCPDVHLFQEPRVMRALERVLFIWAVRHPASGYVQGINDLVTPFITVFLQERLGDSVPDVCSLTDMTLITDEMLSATEADSYWCFSKFIERILDHYTFNQPGIQRMVNKLEDLVKRLDAPLHEHLTTCGLEFLQFGFRWMNCLLMRELPHRLSVRLWDTYLAEGAHFATLHVYVCAALLTRFSAELLIKDFSEILIFLQNVPTASWTEDDVGMLLSQAFMWKSWFEDSPSHYVTR